MKKFIYLLLIVSLFFTSCSDENEDPKLAELPDVNVVDISQESDWDYWVFGKDDYYFIKANSSSTAPEAVLYHSSKINKDFSIFFTEEGLVDKVILDNHIFVFRNFNGNYVDMGVVYPNGQIEIIREIETPNYNWETLTFDKFKNSKDHDFRSELLRWTGHAIAGIPCALSVAAVGPTFGLSTVTAGITCGLFLARLTGDIATSDFNIENGLDEMFMNGSNPYDLGGTILDCASSGLYSAPCISEIVINGYQIYNENSEFIDDLSSNVLRSLTGSMSLGYGDVQINLTWTNNADLDLHVIDPNGEEIFWHNPKSLSGGILDRDDIDGLGPENIYWPPGEAPDGVYKVYVNHYHQSSATSSDYTVLIDAFGFLPRTYTGSIARENKIHIADISRAGWKAIIDKKPISITTNLIKQ